MYGSIYYQIMKRKDGMSDRCKVPEGSTNRRASRKPAAIGPTPGFATGPGTEKKAMT